MCGSDGLNKTRDTSTTYDRTRPTRLRARNLRAGVCKRAHGMAHLRATHPPGRLAPPRASLGGKAEVEETNGQDGKGGGGLVEAAVVECAHPARGPTGVSCMEGREAREGGGLSEGDGLSLAVAAAISSVCDLRSHMSPAFFTKRRRGPAHCGHFQKDLSSSNAGAVPGS